MATVIEAIGTANPPLCKSQRDAAEFVKAIEGIPAAVRCKIDQIYAGSAIERRHTCVADYDLPRSEFEFYPRNAALSPPPSTAQRNALYRKWAPVIAEQAAREALARSGRRADRITHVIAVTCTGFYSPGIDVHLIQSLGLAPSTQRIAIGFMGCCAAFNALRTADAICASDPDSVVLVVCVELCTLHFQPIESVEDAVVSALFADGAAAAILSANPPPSQSMRVSIVRSTTLLDDDTLGDMTWTIGDTGFIMGLSARVPSRLSALLPGYVDTLLGSAGLDRREVDAWLIHPGGRRVLDKAAEALHLAPDALDDSYAVLREYGNMSSATILFILARLLARRGPNLRHVVALGFGPGLTIEGCVLRGA